MSTGGKKSPDDQVLNVDKEPNRIGLPTDKQQQHNSPNAANESTSKRVEMGCGDLLDSEEFDLDSKSNAEDQKMFAKNYDERSLRVPLASSWQRQTLIKQINESGIHGDVLYISPCGKKFENFSEVHKYLMESNKHNLRKEHFNFSSHIVIGEFLEQKSSENHLVDYQLSEEEVINRIESIRRAAFKKPGVGSEVMDKMNIQSAHANTKKSITPAGEQAIQVLNPETTEMEKARQLNEIKIREELARQKAAKEQEAKRLELQKVQETKRKKEQTPQAEELACFSNKRRLQQAGRDPKKRIESEIQKEIKRPAEDMALGLELSCKASRIKGATGSDQLEALDPKYHLAQNVQVYSLVLGASSSDDYLPPPHRDLDSEAMGAVFSFSSADIKSFIEKEGCSFEATESMNRRRSAILYNIGWLLYRHSGWEDGGTKQWDDRSHLNDLVSECLRDNRFGKEELLKSIRDNFPKLGRSDFFKTFENVNVNPFYPNMFSDSNRK